MTESIVDLRDTCRRLNLAGWPILFDLTLEQIEQSYNGIGSAAMPQVVRWTLTEINSALIPAALLHDVAWDYACETEADFYESNEAFEHNGRICADDAYSAMDPRRYFFRLQASKYRCLLDKFGHGAYMACLEGRAKKMRRGSDPTSQNRGRPV